MERGKKERRRWGGGEGRRSDGGKEVGVGRRGGGERLGDGEGLNLRKEEGG